MVVAVYMLTNDRNAGPFAVLLTLVLITRGRPKPAFLNNPGFSRCNWRIDALTLSIEDRGEKLLTTLHNVLRHSMPLPAASGPRLLT